MLLEAFGGTESLPASDPNCKGVAALDTFPRYLSVEVLHNAVYVSVGEDQFPSLPELLVRQSGSLHRVQDRVPRHLETRHQVRDGRKAWR
jgi:hypothetical protein